MLNNASCLVKTRLYYAGFPNKFQYHPDTMSAKSLEIIHKQALETMEDPRGITTADHLRRCVISFDNHLILGISGFLSDIGSNKSEEYKNFCDKSGTRKVYGFFAFVWNMQNSQELPASFPKTDEFAKLIESTILPFWQISDISKQAEKFENGVQTPYNIAVDVSADTNTSVTQGSVFNTDKNKLGIVHTKNPDKVLDEAIAYARQENEFSICVGSDIREIRQTGFDNWISLDSGNGTEIITKNYQTSQSDTDEKKSFNGGREPNYGGNEPNYGGREPNYGGREPYYGGREPNYGGREPNYGGREPYYGGREPYYGGREPYYGGKEPYYGGREPYYGGREPYYGGREPYYGGKEPGLGTEQHSGAPSTKDNYEGKSTYKWVTFGFDIDKSRLYKDGRKDGREEINAFVKSLCKIAGAKDKKSYIKTYTLWDFLIKTILKISLLVPCESNIYLLKKEVIKELKAKWSKGDFKWVLYVGSLSEDDFDDYQEQEETNGRIRRGSSFGRRNQQADEPQQDDNDLSAAGEEMINKLGKLYGNSGNTNRKSKNLPGKPSKKNPFDL